MKDDPNWPRASAWLAGEGNAGASAPSLVLLGVPTNTSLTPGRCDLAPRAIRAALSRYSTYDLDHDVDLARLGVRDAGDLPAPADLARDLDDTAARIRDAIGPATGALLGGDNALTRPGVHALAPDLADCALLTFDAHHDLRDLQDGLHNGNPVRALLQDGLPGSQIVQVGVQPFANSPAYAAVARAAGITVISADAVHASGIEMVVTKALAHLAKGGRRIYVDLDVDVLDRAFAPACPGARPGGLTPAMMRQAAYLCGAHPAVRMIDFVEIDPERDLADVTVLAAASFLLAFASGLARRPRS